MSGSDGDATDEAGETEIALGIGCKSGTTEVLRAVGAGVGGLGATG